MFSKGDKWGQNDKKALYTGLSDCFYLSLMGQILSPYLFSPGTRGDKTSQKPVIKGVSGEDKICPLMRDKLLRGYTKNIKSNTRQEAIKYILPFFLFSLFSYVLHPTIRRGTGKKQGHRNYKYRYNSRRLFQKRLQVQCPHDKSGKEHNNGIRCLRILPENAVQTEKQRSTNTGKKQNPAGISFM